MRSKQVLIVDDSKSARFSLSKLLEQLGHRAQSVVSGESALAFLEHTLPDIILMDHLMPGLDGFQTTSRIKANPLTADIPIIMCTSKEGDAYVNEASAVGAIGLLPKPASHTQVAQMFEQLEIYEQQNPHTPKQADTQTVVEPAISDQQIAEIAKTQAQLIIDQQWDQFKQTLEAPVPLQETQHQIPSLTEEEIQSLIQTQVDAAVQARLDRIPAPQLTPASDDTQQLHEALLEEAKNAAEFTATHKALETAKQVAKEATQHELSDQMQRLYLPQIEQYIHEFLSNQEKKFNQLQLATGLCLVLSVISVALHFFS